MFEKGVIQRLTMLLSNVWQWCHLTFDNGIVQRLTMVLSNV